MIVFCVIVAARFELEGPKSAVEAFVQPHESMPSHGVERAQPLSPVWSELHPHPCMLELKNGMGATPTLLYARIQKWSELQPHPYTLDFKNAKQDGRDARTPTRCPQSYMLEFGNGANPTRTPIC